MAGSLELDDLSDPFQFKPSDDSVIVWFSFLSSTHLFVILPLSVLVGQRALPSSVKLAQKEEGILDIIF